MGEVFYTALFRKSGTESNGFKGFTLRWVQLIQGLVSPTGSFFQSWVCPICCEAVASSGRDGPNPPAQQGPNIRAGNTCFGNSDCWVKLKLPQAIALTIWLCPVASWTLEHSWEKFLQASSTQIVATNYIKTGESWLLWRCSIFSSNSNSFGKNAGRSCRMRYHFDAFCRFPGPMYSRLLRRKPWSGLRNHGPGSQTTFSFTFPHTFSIHCLESAFVLHHCIRRDTCRIWYICFRKSRIDSSSQEVVAGLLGGMVSCRAVCDMRVCRTAPGQQGMHRSWALWRMSLSTPGALGSIPWWSQGLGTVLRKASVICTAV